jgi:serine/threonine protein kinase
VGQDELVLPAAFGPYTVVRLIGAGGMARVYEARLTGLRGFERRLALKMMLPEYANDTEFVAMLIDEAKICVALNHGNICQVHDLGCIDDRYYIAMEYVEGADLNKVVNRSIQRRVTIPFGIIADIGHEICEGLDYAHSKRDDEGRPLNIIHRDISPANILISMAGEVKIVDFGVAKAAVRSQNTTVGVVKGKYQYMSPEQVTGKKIDNRSDIFAAGIVLYETVAGRMMYPDGPDMLDRIRLAEVRPLRRFRPELPKTLEAIIKKALSRHAKDRFQTAAEMGEALVEFRLAYEIDHPRGRLDELMQTLFAPPSSALQTTAMEGRRSKAKAKQPTPQAMEPQEARHPRARGKNRNPSPPAAAPQAPSKPQVISPETGSFEDMAPQAAVGGELFNIPDETSLEFSSEPSLEGFDEFQDDTVANDPPILEDLPPAELDEDAPTNLKLSRPSSRRLRQMAALPSLVAVESTTDATIRSEAPQIYDDTSETQFDSTSPSGERLASAYQSGLFFIRDPLGLTTGPVNRRHMALLVQSGKVATDDEALPTDLVAFGDSPGDSSWAPTAMYVTDPDTEYETRIAQQRPRWAQSDDLKQRRAAQLFMELAVNQSDGLLVFDRTGVHKQVTVVRGRPTYTSSTLAQEQFADRLVHLGLVDAPGLQQYMADAIAAEVSLFDWVVGQGILEQRVAQRCLEQLVRLRLLELFSWDEGRATFAVFDQGAFNAAPLELDVDPYLLTKEGVLKSVEPGDPASWLEVNRAATYLLSGDAEGIIDRLNFSPATVEFVNRFHTPLRLEEVLQMIEAEGADINEIASAILVAEQIGYLAAVANA